VKMADETFQELITLAQGAPRSKPPAKYVKPDGEIDYNENGNVRKGASNTTAAVMSMFGRRLRMNVFTGRAEFDGNEIEDNDVETVADLIDRTYRYSPGSDAIAKAILSIASRSKYHPLQDYLNGLEWDGIARIPELITALGAEPGIATTYIGSFLLAAAARALQPGCKCDTVLILKGPQGARKSTFATILGGKWRAELALDPKSKDSKSALAGVWIVELPELSSFKGAEARDVKGFISSAVDRYRPAYGRFEVQKPRTCVFIGTTNDDTFLDDETGARRFWVVEVGERIDTEWVAANRDQLWAESVARYRRGEPWHLEETDEAEQREQAKAYRDVDTAEPMILEEAETFGGSFTYGQLYDALCRRDARWEREGEYTRKARIRKTLKPNGYTFGKIKATGKDARAWRPPADRP